MIRSAILFLVLFFIFDTCIAAVNAESCVVRGRSVDYGMINRMVRDFGIREKDLRIDKTKMALIYQQRVTDEMAMMYARQDKKIPALKSMALDKLLSLYNRGDTVNIIVKYDYENIYGRHNVLIASLLIDDYECSVRFNDYLVVKREF